MFFFFFRTEVMVIVDDMPDTWRPLGADLISKPEVD